MKRVLCYGDSNTWGYNPITKDRFDKDARWTGVLIRTLGNGYDIIEEGLNGRTTVRDDPIEDHKNGQAYLIPCLEKHRPIDLAILLLGTNDLKKMFHASTPEIAQGVGILVRIIQESNAGINGASPAVLVMAPPPVGKLTDFAKMFEGAKEKSQIFAKQYKRVADALGCAFFDTSTVIISSNVDGIHFEKGEHIKLGHAVATEVRKLIG